VLRTGDPRTLATHLADGAVVLMRTDTLPGLHCRADDADAVARITALKGRAAKKPLLVLCASLDAARAVCTFPSASAGDYAAACWPGPFTLILPATTAAPTAATRGRDSLALRVPGPRRLRELVASAGGLVVSTSVNRSGEPPLTSLSDAVGFCGEAVDVVGDVDWIGGKEEPAAGASGLIDLTGWPPRVVRAGPVVPPEW